MWQPCSPSGVDVASTPYDLVREWLESAFIST
jgi:hypothetical protein